MVTQQLNRKDELASYMKALASLPLLDPEETKRLGWRVINDRDQDARDRLVRANLRLVFSIARRYARFGASLSDLIAEIVDHCSQDLKMDQGDSEELRPWRLLHINRGIVATRTHDLEVMKKAFDEFLIYLPQEATGFFAEGMKEMDALDYPPHVRKVME